MSNANFLDIKLMTGVEDVKPKPPKPRRGRSATK